MGREVGWPVSLAIGILNTETLFIAASDFLNLTSILWPFQIVHTSRHNHAYYHAHHDSSRLVRSWTLEMSKKQSA